MADDGYWDKIKKMERAPAPEIPEIPEKREPIKKLPKAAEKPSVDRIAEARWETPSRPDSTAVFDAAAPTATAPRELPATADVTLPSGKRQRVTIDDELFGSPGHVVDMIDPVRGVHVLHPTDPGQDYWLAPKPPSRHVPKTAANTGLPGGGVGGADFATGAELEADYQRRQHMPYGFARTAAHQVAERAIEAERHLGEARQYQRDHIYTDAENDAWANDAANADFDTMTEGSYWDDHEGTGWRLYKMENADGDTRMFLVSPDETIKYNVTDMVPDPDA